MMESTSKTLGGGLMLIAGLFQFSRLKYACLAHCRSPMGFLATQWRRGPWGASIMGLKHGGYCLGCCWALMALLFVFGVMNLLWVAGLSALVLLEKVTPANKLVSRLSGLLFIGWAVFFWLVKLAALQGRGDRLLAMASTGQLLRAERTQEPIAFWRRLGGWQPSVRANL
jgi:predicted metal-binding membrane protein